MLTQSSIYKEYLDLMDTEAWKYYIILKIYKLQQIFRPRIISDVSTSEKLYNGEIKMYFYLAMVGFEPTPTSTAAPSNTETTVIPSRPLRSLKRSYHGRGLCLISLHYTSDRVTRFRCANTIIYIQGIPGSYGYRSLEIIYYIKDIQAPTDIPAKDHF